MKFTGKPVIIGGRLALKEINPLPKCECKMFTQQFEDCPNINQSVTSCSVFDYHKQAESALRTLFVKSSEFILKTNLHLPYLKSNTALRENMTITANIENNELINLEII